MALNQNLVAYMDYRFSLGCPGLEAAEFSTGCRPYVFSFEALEGLFIDAVDHKCNMSDIESYRTYQILIYIIPAAFQDPSNLKNLV